MCFTSVSEDDQKYSLKIFPNPATDVLQIELHGVTHNALLQILNSLGVVVESFDVGSTSGVLKTSVDVSKLAAGVYFIEVRSKNAFLKVKIIKN